MTFLLYVRVCVCLQQTSNNDWFLRRISPTSFVLCVCVFKVFLLTIWRFRYCFCYGVTVTCLVFHIPAGGPAELPTLVTRPPPCWKSVPTLIYSRSYTWLLAVEYGHAVLCRWNQSECL